MALEMVEIVLGKCQMKSNTKIVSILYYLISNIISYSRNLTSGV